MLNPICESESNSNFSTQFYSSKESQESQGQVEQAWAVAREALNKAIEKADILEKMEVPTKEILKSAFEAKVNLKPQLSSCQKIWNFVSLIIKKIAVFFKLLETTLDKEKSVCLDENSKRVVKIVKDWNQPDLDLDEIQGIFKNAYDTFEKAYQLDPKSSTNQEWTRAIMAKIGSAKQKITDYRTSILWDTMCAQYIIELNK